MAEIDVETACVTWVRTGDLDEVVRSFGGDPGTAEQETVDGLFGMAWEDLEELDEDATGVMLVARHGEWAVLVEPFVFRGMSQALLSGIATEGEAYRVAWTVNMATFVCYVRHGAVVASFDALDLDGARGREWLDGLSVSEADWHADWRVAAFAVGEELSGIRIDADWLARPHALYPLRPVTVSAPVALRVDERMTAIAAVDPRVARIVAEPTPDKLPEIVNIAAGLAVTTAGIDGPLVEEALRLIANGARSGEVVARLHALRADYSRRSVEAYHACPADSRDSFIAPGHDTTYGRWVVKGAAVAALSLALNPDEELSSLALQVVNMTGGTYLSEENGDIARHHALGTVAYFLAEGENP
ncbi:DUF6461 domain-containing protein [Streptosporangium sp. NBC_01469]|uniref:DUF6461 domain-containing protein n=1 Tax=Streptosporangium sp. NBC_01469 TaxID=2903898 RepID=UPI002E2B5224|nr:DUF6461 domain-containing protein [Streptosporangium sp. NBC_01469]